MNEFWRQMIASIKSMRSPMRPEPAEVALIESTITARQNELEGAAGQALLLGVTEEIVALHWPEEVGLDAVDRSEAMIDAFWKGDVPGRRRLRQANWWEMDAAFGPYRYAIGDGVFNLQPYPEDFRAFAKRIHSVMETGGLAFFRVFSRPDEPYSEQNVIEQFHAGKLTELQQLRFCLAIAGQDTTGGGNALNIPDAVRRMESHGLSRQILESLPDFDSVARPMMAFDDPHSLVLYYPTRAQFEAAVEPWFDVVAVAYGDQPLKQLCPTYVLSAREIPPC